MAYTNYFILDDNKFTLLNNGIGVGDMLLQLRFILGDFTLEDIERYVRNISDILNIYDMETKEISGTFKGYTDLHSITKIVDYELEDGTYGDVIELVLERPEDVWFYVNQIKKGKMTIDDVPARLKEAVEKALKY